MKSLKIGITINADTSNSLWHNGILLNALFLHRVLAKTHDVCFITFKQFENVPYYLKDINIFCFSEKLEELDVLIILGADLAAEDFKKFI